MGLLSPVLAGNERIRRAAMNAPPMAAGERGAGVAILQAALIDVGYKLPLSTAYNGTTDGVFGTETRNALYQFQIDQKLKKQDGIAGKETLERLAQRLWVLHPPHPSPPPAPAPAPLPSTRDYEVGSADPRITPDPGAGPWNSKPKTAAAITQKGLILEALPTASVAVGPDAAGHMSHYLGNSGKDLAIDLEAMIADVPTAAKRFQNEVAQARQFVELLPPGLYRITAKSAESAYNFEKESRNWYFAVGGYSTWGKGEATVTVGPGGRQYQLLFEYRFCDRYNWDKGKAVSIFGLIVTDAFMGEFHRQGLAREFDMKGTIRRNFTWRQGEVIPAAQYQPPGGR